MEHGKKIPYWAINASIYYLQQGGREALQKGGRENGHITTQAGRCIGVVMSLNVG